MIKPMIEKAKATLVEIVASKFSSCAAYMKTASRTPIPANENMESILEIKNTAK